MNIEIFSLCDAATADFGKMNLLGAFDTVGTRLFPLIYPQCAIALRIRFESIESGRHVVTLRLVDEDGRQIIPELRNESVVQIPPSQKSGSANLILNLQGIKFEKPGTFSIDLAIEGRQEASLPLFVRQAPELPAPPNVPPFEAPAEPDLPSL